MKINYGSIILKLLPIGAAYIGDNLKILCNALGKEFYRVRLALFKSLNEIPGSLVFNLSDWERCLNISPDSNDDTKVRNARILSKLSPLKGHSLIEYLNFIERISGNIPVISFKKINRSGHRCGSRCNSYRWGFILLVSNIPNSRINLVKEILGIYKQSHSIFLINIEVNNA